MLISAARTISDTVESRINNNEALAEVGTSFSAHRRWRVSYFVDENVG